MHATEIIALKVKDYEIRKEAAQLCFQHVKKKTAEEKKKKKEEEKEEEEAPPPEAQVDY